MGSKSIVSFIHDIYVKCSLVVSGKNVFLDVFENMQI